MERMVAHRARTVRSMVTALVAAVGLGCGGAAGTGRTPTTPDPEPELSWQSWSPEVFERARRDGRLLLVSVQADWCHWCHVMNDTTYRDPRVVRVLEESFVTIRVDSDARPDLAERYARWGWPATAFLTPDARPVSALRGHRGPDRFLQILSRLVSDHRAGRPLAVEEPELAPDPALADLSALRAVLRAQLDGLYDPELHGWGRGQKYPYAAPAQHALRRASAEGDDAAGSRALRSLEAHALLIDPVWGGMYQYSERGTWQRPHFEKIVPVQAGAIASFAQAYAATADPAWLERAHDVLRYVLGPLRDPAGGFYTSQDADVRSGATNVPGPEFYALADAERRAIGEPRVDRAVYADRNGMLIAALAAHVQATGDAQVLAHARAAAERLRRTHFRPGRGYLHAEDADGRLHLSDQAWMAWGLVSLHQATGEARWLDEADELMALTRRHLGDADGGGFFAVTEDAAAVGAFARRRKPLEANAVAARVLLRLHRLRDDDRDLREQARAAVRAVADRRYIAEHGRKVGELAIAVDELLDPYVVLSVVGPPDRAETEALRVAAMRVPAPARLVRVSRPGEGRYPYPGEPAVYLCTRDACSLPITRPDALAAEAAGFLRPRGRDG